MKYKIAICDDSINAIQNLKRRLNTYNIETDVEFIISCYTSPAELVDYCKSNTPFPYDIIFLDIEMEPFTGIDAAKKIRSIPNNNVRIVFFTDYEEYIKYSFEVQAVHYINKTATPKEFRKAIDLVINNLENDNSMVRIKTGRDTFNLVKLNDIVYIESIPSKRDLIRYHMSDGFTIEEKSSILSISKELKSKGFVVVNKHAFVNIQYILGFTKEKVTLKNDMEFKISRAYKKSFSEVFMKRIVNTGDTQ